jgi:MerR family transcriptional regulator, copper efflux regulator
MLKISELSALTDTPASAIRYYESQGLLPGVQRTPGGSRRYDEPLVLRIRMLRFLQSMGFTLADIPTLLSDDLHAPNHRAVLDSLQQKLTDVDQLLGQLQQKRIQLSELFNTLNHSWQAGHCLNNDAISALLTRLNQPPTTQ